MSDLTQITTDNKVKTYYRSIQEIINYLHGLSKVAGQNYVSTTTVDHDYTSGDTYTLPKEYTVGANELFVTYGGTLLHRNYEYQEIGGAGTKSNSIELLIDFEQGTEISEILLGEGNTYFLDPSRVDINLSDYVKKSDLLTGLTGNTVETVTLAKDYAVNDVVPVPFSYEVGQNQLFVIYGGVVFALDHEYSENTSNSIVIKTRLTEGMQITFIKLAQNAYVDANRVTISTMGGASADGSGTSGLVPAAPAGKENCVLTGSGEWKTLEELGGGSSSGGSGSDPAPVVSGLLPGFITLFNGTTIPDGYVLCNGSNGTPDLSGYTTGNVKYIQKV